MKTIKKIGLLATFASVFAMVSCDNNEPEISSRAQPTYYPIITLSGDDPAYVHAGDTYVDPGAVATINGEEVPLETRFVGKYRGNVYTDLDTSVSDIYNLEYSAVNSDGFTTTATRQVIVAETGDLVNNIAGLYRVTTRRNGTLLPASQGSSVDMEYILIWKNPDGTYGLSDAAGGWYAIGRNIPDSETPGGIIVANNIATNDFSFPATMTNTYFGGTATITSLTVNPATKTLVLVSPWLAPPATNYVFELTMTQVEF